MSETVLGNRLHHVEVNGIQLRIAERGDGPLVLLLHGWPESWYSWRHQLPALAEAGYRAVAPDMRGYGHSAAPADVADYDILDICGDVVGLIDALGADDAVVVGHDWGAIVAWHCALLEPDRFSAVINMSVPYSGRGEESLIRMLERTYDDNFFYILYFQEPGIAEKEFDSDPRGILSRLYTSPDTPRGEPTTTDPKRSAGGMIPRLGAPTELPAWLADEDLDYYVGEFAHAGFRGGINYYRNFHRNWELTPQLSGALVSQPTLFIAGEKDGVIRGQSKPELEASMGQVVRDLRGVHLVPGAGHWIQQERADEVNRLLIEFLSQI